MKLHDMTWELDTVISRADTKDVGGTILLFNPGGIVNFRRLDIPQNKFKKIKYGKRCDRIK